MLVTLTVGRVPRERTKRKQTNGVMMVASELKTQSVGSGQVSSAVMQQVAVPTLYKQVVVGGAISLKSFSHMQASDRVSDI